MDYDVEIESINSTTDGWDEEDSVDTIQIEFKLVSNNKDPKWRNVTGSITVETPLDHSASAVLMARKLNEAYKNISDMLGEWSDAATGKYRSNWPVRRVPKKRPTTTP